MPLQFLLRGEVFITHLALEYISHLWQDTFQSAFVQGWFSQAHLSWVFHILMSLQMSLAAEYLRTQVTSSLSLRPTISRLCLNSLCIRNFCIKGHFGEKWVTSDLTDTGWILRGAPFNVGLRAGRDFKENSDKPVVLEEHLSWIGFVVYWGFEVECEWTCM